MVQLYRLLEERLRTTFFVFLCPHTALLRECSLLVLCSVIMLVMLKELYLVLEIEPRLATSKSSSPPTTLKVLSPEPKTSSVLNVYVVKIGFLVLNFHCEYSLSYKYFKNKLILYFPVIQQIKIYTVSSETQYLRFFF